MTLENIYYSLAIFFMLLGIGLIITLVILAWKIYGIAMEFKQRYVDRPAEFLANLRDNPAETLAPVAARAIKSIKKGLRKRFDEDKD